jgi:galactokinase
VIESRLVLDTFSQLFMNGAPRLFHAPGRVNLIGEHTDYNDGFVLPMAIDRGTLVAARARDDALVRAHSINRNETVEFDLDEPGPKGRGLWIDYLEGVGQALRRRVPELRGAELVIASDVPAGAGLSSSAALEISAGMALLSVSGGELEMVALALAGQEAEHTYVGTKCGIMDQLTAACGRSGHALLIDCRSLETTPIPLDTSEVAIVICDTQVKHELVASEYNTRRAECEQGVGLLREVLPGIRALRDVSLADLEEYGARLPSKIRRRCLHVVTENARTLAAAAALRARRMPELGRLMVQSHASLRDDYEVSCMELDTLVDEAIRIEGVLGARMTGGGFGGCTVNLVRREALAGFRETVSREYNEKIGRDITIYVVEASEGAREIAYQEEKRPGA